MREANCFPPAEHNPSSLTPTSSSQPPVALQEPLCLRPQLIPNSLGLFFFFGMFRACIAPLLLLHFPAHPGPPPQVPAVVSSVGFVFFLASQTSPVRARSPRKFLRFSPSGKENSSAPTAAALRGLHLLQAAQRRLSLGPCTPHTPQGRGMSSQLCWRIPRCSHTCGKSCALGNVTLR